MARHNGSATSAVIAAMLNANPVVVRRTMAGLRDAGYVRSEKGHGGGWTLSCDLDQLTVHDIYTALGEPTIFAIGVATDQPGCLIEQMVNNALQESFRAAEALLVERLADITLGQLDREIPTLGSADLACENLA
jgi:DNA-binding IscR family transcriptional regulator